MNHPAPETLRRTNNCCQRKDGLWKQRFPTLETAKQAAATITDVHLRAYECATVPGSWHLTSKPTQEVTAHAD